MDTQGITKKFEKMEGRIKFHTISGFARSGTNRYVIDIRTDKRGEYFDLTYVGTDLRLQVLDVQCRDRHLLLLVDSRSADNGHEKTATTWEKFLCGHNERHWFIAGVDNRCRGVKDAKESLKPEPVVSAQMRRGVKRKNWQKRKNAGFIRQGEWFFMPVTDMNPSTREILYREPLRRGQGKPHMAEKVYRTGGQKVYVSYRYPNGITEDVYRRRLKDQPEMRHQGWRVMVRDPEVYAQGWIRHPDHKTIHLSGWHRIFVNGEVLSQKMAFLD